MANKPRVIEVKERKLEERAPPSPKEFRFLESHEPRKTHRRPAQA